MHIKNEKTAFAPYHRCAAHSGSFGSNGTTATGNLPNAAHAPATAAAVSAVHAFAADANGDVIDDQDATRASTRQYRVPRVARRAIFAVP